ncbi:hypothetical protein EZ428_16750 [Pedobacter frigiditerrae]|uniref:WD40-like Beta Propeller Repeat n=1 Tax=Pedobacter frigiditerrae TaxID=2530452 RepID=A0A4R0MTS5_9SPHI|nr:hypothetical protein [Pedobacter frigiditerrae]TCC89344.1 hypothetical protein EZ428_16750 [Pedobacter frigiditerrae]
MIFKNSNTKLIISILTTILSSIISVSCFGQIFDSEQNPLSVKWKKIYTNGFSIIYPTELENDAQRMANTINKIYPFVGQSLGRQKTTIPIVLQNRGTVANGFVQLAPKKSQFYTTPPQQFDSQDWLNNLAVHELRHVAQFDKITGSEKLFLTEEIYFAYMGITVPTWFFEGDAVSTETSLTNAGRGRQPSWIMPFRTSLLSSKNFSYSKAYFGSNKGQTPGYYQLGYLMSSDLRKNYGKGIMDSLLSDIHDKPIRLYPFSRSLKNYTGKNTKDYYLKTAAQIKSDWQKQDDQNKSENYLSLNRPAKYASNYYLPTEISTTQILALKQTKGDVAGFVLVNPDKSEERLFKIAYQEQPWFSYGDGKIVWDEIRYDPRYKQRSYSVICIYDFATKTKKQLTFKSRYFSPALSGDGKKLIAVQIDLRNKSNLIVLDTQSGKILETIPNPENLILQTPSLNANGSKITWISVSEKGKALWLSENGKSTKLIAETNQQLSRPMFLNQNIAFNAHLSGVDNVYEVLVADKKIVVLTAAKFGAFNPNLSIDGKSILFNNYQLMGYEIAKTPVDPKPVQENHFVYFGEAAEKQENSRNVFDKIPNENYDSKPYKPLAHLFNFHSISLSTDDDDKLNLQLKSNDLLNTFDFYTGIGYDDELRKIEYNAGFAYKALYPVLSATFKNRPRLGYYRQGTVINKAEWRENYLKIKASIPVSFSAYNHNYSFVGEVGTSYTQRNFEAKEALLFNKNINFPMTYQFGFSHSVRAAERDVAPKWAQTVTFSYFNQPFDKSLNGDLFAFESNFYFPGIAKSHSFTAGFNYQKTSGTLNFNNEINTVYGYNQITAKSLLRNTLLLNYRFPIAFPDLEIGSLAYIRNFRGGFFSHYENIGSETNLSQPKTFGLELRSSMNLLRYQPIVDLGARLVFVNQIYNQNPILEFTFNYSF